jgi:putative protease
MKKIKKPELLAPAGDLKKLKTAFLYGADAVYLGLPAFSLRAKTGFDMKSLKEGIDYAHKLKKKVYVTINVFAHNRHIKLLPKHLKQLKNNLPDAIIVSDPGVLELVKKELPQVEIHLSTQSNTLNYEAVKFWYKQGVSRIILGREVDLKDIKEIHKKFPKMELEVFVHGAMCMSYSGRCYLSTYFNQRSANLGLCTQPCRWEYGVYLEEPQKPGNLIKVTSDDKGTYIMNSRDLRLIDYLADLQKSGVASFKLEGRTKSIYYLAVATRAYRQAIDSGYKKEKISDSKKELDKVDNRGYTTGFLLGDEEGKREEFKTSKAVSDWEFVGEVVKVEKNKLYIKPHNALNAKENVEIVTPNSIYKTKIKEFFDNNNKSIDKVRGGTEKIYYIELSSKYDIVNGSLIRKKK